MEGVMGKGGEEEGVRNGNWGEREKGREREREKGRGKEGQEERSSK